MKRRRNGVPAGPAQPRWRGVAGFVLAVCSLCMLLVSVPARAQSVELASFVVTRGEDGVLLNFATQFDLPRVVEDALQKGVPLHFVAEAEVYRERWYWKDKRVAEATRVWRLAYQPLTRKYRVSFGGLNQNFDGLAEALAAVQRVVHWKLAEVDQIREGDSHYVKFSYKLDATLLPRPMQIGIEGQPEWNLQVEKIQRIE
jgi:hypothetical protein